MVEVTPRTKKAFAASLVLTLLWTLCRAAALWHTGIPQPRIHDEFSYILQADIFAHGHLAMPGHPLPAFFESPHILVHPTLASKYPPGQSMFLALGQRFLGSPFYGVLLGNALMLFALCLMLCAWAPLPWALAVSAMFGLMLSPGMYWTSSYWGGSLAAAGGALVMLGVGIYRARQTPLAGLVFAAGALLLFWTRPFEGGAFTLILLVVFARDIWRKRRVSAFSAAIVLFALGAAFTCRYNKAVTGSALQLPYQLHFRQYNVTPVFWFLPLHSEPHYSDPRLAAQYGNHGWEINFYQPNRPRWQMLPGNLFGSIDAIRLSLRVALLLVLLIPLAWRDRLFRKMAIVVGGFLLALAFETYHLQHYAAPVWPAIALMIVLWARHAWHLRAGKHRIGIAVVILVLTLPITVALGRRALQSMNTASTTNGHDGKNSLAADWPNHRAALIARLSQLDRKQLVIVRYPRPDWNLSEEWVYNGADSDGQAVVFAHDLGAQQNRALLDYYSGRDVQLLTFDSYTGAEHLQPYSATQDTAN
jgi:hypothetical protein